MTMQVAETPSSPFPREGIAQGCRFLLLWHLIGSYDQEGSPSRWPNKGSGHLPNTSGTIHINLIDVILKNIIGVIPPKNKDEFS